MNNYQRLIRCNHCFIRNYSTVRPKVVPDENIIKDIENNVYKPRQHPGIIKPRTIELPERLISAIENVCEDEPVKTIIKDSESLKRYLHGRHPPLENSELKDKAQQVQDRVLNKYKKFQVVDENNRLRYDQSVKDTVSKILSKEVYNWNSVDYNTYNCLLYLFARIAPEYAVLYKIFNEIAKRDPDFQPKSLFDFGSGVGSVTWAAINFWQKTIYEYFNVDASVDMNDLAQLLLQDGRGTKKMWLRGVFYRQFLPATHATYDLVVSAYSLLELPSQQARLETILNLWNKTHKYLVIVEQGTNVGFHIVNEIRDFILEVCRKSNTEAHVFSPCPHENICPRFAQNDNTPCNFQIQYSTLPIGTVCKTHHERYSYVVIKRGKRDADDPQWPRIVREVLVRSKHSICRICTKDGNLQEIIFTPSKHGKTIYRCARSTEWGDLLPITIENEENDRDSEQS